MFFSPKKSYIVIALPFQHKLNYFLFCQKIEKLFIICAKLLINLKVQLSRFEPQTFHDNWSNLDTLDWFITLTHCFFVFLIIITCWNFQNKKPSAKVEISNLNNYSAICCQNGKGTMILQ